MPAATITGRLLTSHGRPLRNQYVFADRFTGAKDFEQTETSDDTDQHGRFQLTGLRPGSYAIGIGFPTQDHPAAFTHRFTLVSGQKLDATLTSR